MTKCEQFLPSHVSTGTNFPGKTAPHYASFHVHIYKPTDPIQETSPHFLLNYFSWCSTH